MGTTRRFSRNIDRFSLNNLSKATKLQRVVSAVTAMGFVLQPVAALWPWAVMLVCIIAM